MGADRVLCLGDVVGYGADPGPALDLIGGLEVIAVAGNHDHGAAGCADLGWFNPTARRAVEWTAGRLRSDQIAYLAGLPLIRETPGATLVHASPRDPAAWPYVLTPADGAVVFAAFESPLCFLGHSHVPAAWALGADGRVLFRVGAGRIELRADARYLINAGSVGQPRDGDPLAAYALWDLEARVVEIRRVPYDCREARRRIHGAGLPRVLGDRLLRGW